VASEKLASTSSREVSRNFVSREREEEECAEKECSGILPILADFSVRACLQEREREREREKGGRKNARKADGEKMRERVVHFP